MKQTVIDILIYLFENYIDDEIDLEIDYDNIKIELKEAGFDPELVREAFDWLHGLAASRDDFDQTIVESATSVRVYAVEEQDKLDSECRGFLHFLEQIGVLDPSSRELVIDRVMALEADEIDIGQLKWIVLMVLFNQPGQEHAFMWMEDLVVDDMYGFVH